MSNKGFNARLAVGHDKYKMGEVVYMKVCERDHVNNPIMYAILNRDTGKAEGYADGNEFSNRFIVL